METEENVVMESGARYISVREFERKVRALEEISIAVYAPASTLVQDYDYERQAASTTSLTEWQNKRIKPLLGALEYSLINSDYALETPNGRSKMETIRKSYER